MDAIEIPLSVYIDLSKRFDSLIHKILLSKLQFCDITGASLSLLTSYLSKTEDDVVKAGPKFIWSCFNSHNLIVRNISMAAKISSFSDFGDNYRYLSYKYRIGIHV